MIELVARGQEELFESFQEIIDEFHELLLEKHDSILLAFRKVFDPSGDGFVSRGEFMYAFAERNL